MISYTCEKIYCDMCYREIPVGICFEWREGARVCLGRHEDI